MFLSTSHKALAGLFAAGVFFVSALAAADAKQCVQQNNDGAELRGKHQMLAARDAYRACVAETECPAIIRSECDAALNDIRTSIPTLLVAVLDDDGHDLPGATLVLDGHPVPIDGSALEVDPGEHELTASRGSWVSHLQVMAIENDANRRVGIVLRAPEPARQVAARSPVPAARRSNVPAFVLSGFAAVGATSFGYFALTGHSDLKRLNQCKPYCDAPDVNRVRGEYLIADVSLGVSVLALVGAGYWLLSPPHETSSAREQPLSFALTAQPHAAGLSVRWLE
jgi:hypothetical protein